MHERIMVFGRNNTASLARRMRPHMDSWSSKRKIRFDYYDPIDGTWGTKVRPLKLGKAMRIPSWLRPQNFWELIDSTGREHIRRGRYDRDYDWKFYEELDRAVERGATAWPLNIHE